MARINKGKASYEGKQYRGGRQRGRKNLQKVDGGYVNKFGVTFTEEQKKALEKAVNRSNYRRKKQLDAMKDDTIINEGKDTGIPKNQLYLMGKDSSDFIISRQSKSLQRFRSMEDYENYMLKQERIRTGEYMDDKARLYKKNFMDSLLETYGDDAKDIVMKVRMMKPQDYMKMVASDETLEISYVPSDEKVQGRLNQLRASLGMKLKDEWLDEEIEIND